jgi:hypothetical protein
VTALKGVRDELHTSVLVADSTVQVGTVPAAGSMPGIAFSSLDDVRSRAPEAFQDAIDSLLTLRPTPVTLDANERRALAPVRVVSSFADSSGTDSRPCLAVVGSGTGYSRDGLRSAVYVGYSCEGASGVGFIALEARDTTGCWAVMRTLVLWSI